jgi:hypothetical protein
MNILSISAPPPAAGGWPSRAGRRGLGAAATGWGGARKVIVFFQYDLISLCFNKKCVSPASFGERSRSFIVLSSNPTGGRARPKILAPGVPEIPCAISCPPIIDCASSFGASCLHGVCFYAPTTSFAGVVLRCAWNISAPPPAAGAGPPGLGGKPCRYRPVSYSCLLFAS